MIAHAPTRLPGAIPATAVGAAGRLRFVVDTERTV
jgi:hypothetical protein